MSNDTTFGDDFGLAVAIDGNTAVVGAFRHDVGANTDQGAAYVFVLDNGVWTQQAQLIADDGAINDRFGNSVSIDGDTVVVGDSSDDVGDHAIRARRMSLHVMKRFGRNKLISRTTTLNRSTASLKIFIYLQNWFVLLFRPTSSIQRRPRGNEDHVRRISDTTLVLPATSLI